MDLLSTERVPGYLSLLAPEKKNPTSASAHLHCALPSGSLVRHERACEEAFSGLGHAGFRV